MHPLLFRAVHHGVSMLRGRNKPIRGSRLQAGSATMPRPFETATPIDVLPLKRALETLGLDVSQASPDAIVDLYKRLQIGKVFGDAK
jgi:hypothetical protein